MLPRTIRNSAWTILVEIPALLAFACIEDILKRPWEMKWWNDPFHFVSYVLWSIPFYNLDTFHNIRIKARDEWKMAFNCTLGCFQFKVLSFGLQGAPAIFMQFINELLHEHLYKGVLMYLYCTGLRSEPGSNCHQFIPSFAQIALPITNLLKMKGEDMSKPSQLLECQAALRET